MLAAHCLTTWLNGIASQSSVVSNASISQPGFVESPNAGWRFTWDPCERAASGPCDVRWIHRGETSSTTQLKFTPAIVAIDDEGNVALSASIVWEVGETSA